MLRWPAAPDGPSPRQAVELVARPGATGIRWVEADPREYQPGPAAYDLVLLAYVHLPPDESRAQRR